MYLAPNRLSSLCISIISFIVQGSSSEGIRFHGLPCLFRQRRSRAAASKCQMRAVRPFFNRYSGMERSFFYFPLNAVQPLDITFYPGPPPPWVLKGLEIRQRLLYKSKKALLFSYSQDWMPSACIMSGLLSCRRI